MCHNYHGEATGKIDLETKYETEERRESCKKKDIDISITKTRKISDTEKVFQDTIFEKLFSKWVNTACSDCVLTMPSSEDMAFYASQGAVCRNTLFFLSQAAKTCLGNGVEKNF